MGEKTLFFITRHASKDEKFKNIWTGQIDAPLSDKGKKESEELGEKLNSQNINFDVIISSKMKRCAETAKIVKSKLHNNPELLFFEELKEMTHGEIDGLTEEDITKNYPKIIKSWNNDEDPVFPKGENFKMVEDRIMPIIDSILKKYEHKNILFIGHKSVNMVLVGNMLRMPLQYRYVLQQDKCYISLFILKNNKAKLKFLNINPKNLNDYNLI